VGSYHTTDNNVYFIAEGRRKKEEPVVARVSAIKNVLTVLAVAIFASFNSNKDAYEQHQDDPPAAQPYNYPGQEISFLRLHLSRDRSKLKM